MAITSFSDMHTAGLVKEAWSDMFMKELRQNNLLIGQVDKSYSGQILAGGDTVKVSQINKPTGSLLTIGTDADSFTSEAVSTSQVDVVANKVAIASYEFENDSLLLSQLSAADSEIRASLLAAVAEQINGYLYTLFAPSASAPDHQLVTTDFNAAELSLARLTAATAKWPTSEPWMLNVAPSYYSDILDDTTLSSIDYGAQDAPMIGGQLARQRMGFDIYEDNSLATDIGYAFVKDAIHLVMVKEAQFKLSDLHAQYKRGTLLSVEVIFGAAAGIDADVKSIKWTAS